MSALEEEPKGDPNAWLATFGDLITLLMTFFVLMLSFSTLNSEKFTAALGSIDMALGMSAKTRILNKDGVLGIANPHVVTKVEDGEESPAGKDPMGNVYEDVVEYLTQSKYAQFLELKKTKQGFVITIASNAFFDEGKSELKSEDVAALDKLAELVRLFPNKISVSGHIGKGFAPTEEYQSSMDLSIARAVNTCRYFLNQGISPDRLGVAGYGSHRPLPSNASRTSNIRDNRIEITILNVQQ